jgi:hypothetical protein
MRNYYITYIDVDEDKLRILEEFGLTSTILGFNRFDFEENELFFSLRPFLEKWNSSIKTVSKYSKLDEDNAPFLAAISKINPFYPMPDKNSDFRDLSYDLKNYHPLSGTGMVQKSPFRIKNEPKWTKNMLFELHWVRDEFFVHPEIYEKIFKPLGLDFWPVLQYKNESILQTVIQLKIPESQSSLILDEYNFINTPNGKRYDIIDNGFFPKFSNQKIPFQIFKTKEYFGTGAKSFKYIMISQSLRKKIIEAKLKLIYIPQAPKNTNSSIQ